LLYGSILLLKNFNVFTVFCHVTCDHKSRSGW
jgi:hypothetical protein